MTASIIPPELIEQCLRHVQPLGDVSSVQSLARCRAVSRQFHVIASQDVLWQPHLVRWKHHSRQNQAQDEDCFSTVARRWQFDALALQNVNMLVYEPHRRGEAYQSLASIGMDAFDLLRHEYAKLADLTRWPLYDAESGDYWLSRRHWLKEALGFLSRRDAMDTLTRLADPKTKVAFEDALMIFSSFLGADRLEMSAQITNLAERCKSRLDEQIRSRDLVGVAQGIHDFMADIGIAAASPGAFHDIANNFVHIVITECRPTLPMSLVWLYCSIASRLGIEATPVGFPSTVLACVNGWQQLAKDEQPSEPFYFDLYRNLLHSRANLADQLHQHDFPAALHQELLDTARPRDIVLRSARNIYNSIGIQVQGGQADQTIDRETMLYTSAYAASATLLCLNPLQPGTDSAELLTSVIRQRFPWDAASLTEELARMAKHNPAKVMSMAARERNVDDLKGPRIKQRPPHVRYSVGQVFRHVKFDYIGLVVSWDEHCEAREDWQRQMGVSLESSAKPFYTSIVSEGDQRYVMEDNVEPVAHIAPEDVLTLLHAHPQIGLYFRSIDAASGRFKLSMDSQLTYKETEASA